MTHFGIICLGATGHLNTMFPLGRELQQRGHRVTIFSSPSVELKALAAGFEFRAIGESEFTPESEAKLYEQQGKLSGLAALRHTLDCLKERTDVCLRETPAIVKDAGVEALLVDLSAFEGGTVAERLNLPFITISCVLSFYEEKWVPPVCTAWKYNPSWWGRLRNRTAYSLFNRIGQPIQDVIAKYRRGWGLPAYSGNNDYFSKLAIISQHPAELEFPRRELPPYFHFTGSFHDSTGRPFIDFPFEKLTGKPLIYASLGTLQNRLEYIFSYIAEACLGLDAQLVISLGGSLTPEALPNLPGNPLVVEYAPQLELLQKASLAITHAGMNTAVESLTNGVPMVAIPIAADQPGVAARIAWSGAGEILPLSSLRVPKLRQAIKRVLTEKSYEYNAVRLQQAIHQAGGVSRAADIIEKALFTGKPVLAGDISSLALDIGVS
jgi:zeaxanthin glucosyltransferase